MEKPIMISRRVFLKNLGAGSAAVSLLGCTVFTRTVAQSAKPSKPNIVIFYADDFGWGDIRLHNTRPDHFRYTPNMDRLFSEGS